MRVALYARVSTVDKGQDPEIQLRELRAYARQQEYQITGEFVDYESGAKAKRPALTALLNELSKGVIEAIIVVGLDRLGRSLKDLVILADELHKRNIALVCLREKIDCSSMAGRMALYNWAILAEFERELLRARVKAALAHAKARGVKLGRHPVINEADQLRIFAMRRKGLSIRAIAKDLGVSRSVVHRSLHVSGTAPNPAKSHYASKSNDEVLGDDGSPTEEPIGDLKTVNSGAREDG